MSEYYVHPEAIVEVGSNVSRRVRVEPGAWIHTQALVLDDVYVGESADIGVGAQLRRGVQVARSARVSAGAVLHNNAFVGGGAFIGERTRLGRGAWVSEAAQVFAGAVLLDGVRIGEESEVGERSRLERAVKVGPGVNIGEYALILEGAIICPNDVNSTSTNGRTLEDRVIVGRGVLLHDEVELGANAIVPTQDTIKHIGSLGGKNRVITIYGSDDGPRISLGCNVGVSYDAISENILGNAESPGGHTTEASAGSYVPYLPVMNLIGAIVQSAYDREYELVGEMKHMWTELVA